MVKVKFNRIEPRFEPRTLNQPVFSNTVGLNKQRIAIPIFYQRYKNNLNADVLVFNWAIKNCHSYDNVIAITW